MMRRGDLERWMQSAPGSAHKTTSPNNNLNNVSSKSNGREEIMEVVSSSEVEYAREASDLEQNSGTKSDRILEQPTLQVDCFKHCLGTKVPLTIPESEMSILEANNVQQLHNDNHESPIDNGGTPVEIRCTPIKSMNKQLTGANMVEEIFQNVDHCLQAPEDEVSHDCYRVNNALKNDHTSQLGDNYKGNFLFAVEKGVKRDLDQHKTDTALPCSPHLSGYEQRKEAVISSISHEANELELKAKKNVRRKDEGGADERPVSDSFIPMSSNSQLYEKELPSSSHVESHVEPNRKNIEYELLSLHKENKNSLCGTDKWNPTMQNVGPDLLNCNKKDPESRHQDQECTIAIWVKWRGKWQTGILCSRIDFPLQTLRAKPTHDRKKYSIVFFPHTRTYYWVDLQLVCSINEFPKPLAYGTHIDWLALVEDLTLPRCYIMRKLALSMLNISDQLHTEAVIESARKATYWKEFALEASRCRSYCDLGNMLVKLQRIILPVYVNPEWLSKSSDSWLHQCQNAQSAESVELLTEQLVDSVLWKAVEELWDAPVQPELGSEWRTWKQEAMKLFYTSHPLCSDVQSRQKNCSDCVSVGPQISRKRPKLEIRRSEVCGPEFETGSLRYQSTMDNAGFYSNNFQHNDSDDSSPVFSPHETKLSGMVAGAVSRNMADKIFLTDKDLKNVHQTVGIANVAAGTSGKALSFDAELALTKKYRRCSAFMEAKGRQCGRWASDGENYCCVHLRGQPSINVFPREHSPLKTLMCEGTTIHGKKCKHKAREGSSFCKKHGCLTSYKILNSAANNLERKHEGDNLSENILRPHDHFEEENQASFHNMVPVAIGEALDEGNCLMNKSKLSETLPAENSCNAVSPHCIGHGYNNDSEQCSENAKLHTLYCDKHVPNFLKQARDGKSRLISKDVFINLLRSCTSRREKINLHRACELLYGYMESGLSHQKSVSSGEHVRWILSEVSKDRYVGQYLLKLVSSERHKIGGLLGLSTVNDKLTLPFETKPVPVVASFVKDHKKQITIRCKICKEEFIDDQALGIHWREIHKKEAQWLFRGYACSICMNSFTNRKVLEVHVTENHGVQFLEHSVLLRCMSCNSHLATLEKLWEHILSFHSIELRHTTSSQQNALPAEQVAVLKMVNDETQNCAEKKDGPHRYICKICGLKFDLLPDLGRHHQASHVNCSMRHLRKIKMNRHLKTRKFRHSRFKKGTGARFRIKKTNFGMEKHFQASNSVIAERLHLQNQASEALGLGSLLDSQCSTVAKMLFAEVCQTKPCPSNIEIIAIVRSACCQTYIHNVFLEKYGTPSRNLYVKSAKYCSELNIPISWHLEGFTCPKGCKPLGRQDLLDHLVLSDELVEPSSPLVDHATNSGWEMDEFHYILSSTNFCGKTCKPIVLCEDVSFGKESVPVTCVIDENIKHLLSTNDGDFAKFSLPWMGFTYVTERLLDSSLCLDTTNSQLGCGCQQKCCAGSCDHVYLFNNDYENANDVHGQSMHGRFPYDERGHIILEEGYLVYECNTMCNCDSTCQNRVLQNGLRVKLEVFRTEKKGWAVRAGEAISRGTFVCEYIGEVLNDVEANKRGERYDNEGCSYLYDIDAHIDDWERYSDVLVPYVIDATKYGNVSRFINHSCSPNLVNYQVLVESMDCQLARIGLYASRDIAVGEELVYDYRYKLLPGDGCPCHCGSSQCRGRLY